MTWLRALRRWRDHATLIACAAEKALPGIPVFIVGGAAENRLTAFSDIDVVIVLPRKPSFEEAIDLRTKILEEADKLGLPLTIPIEIHLIDREELKRYKALKQIKCSKSSNRQFPDHA